VGDGVEPLTVACRFGRVQVGRHVLAHGAVGRHVMPANVVLPAHATIVITRGLQEWAYLLPQDLPFTTAARLLGWQAHEPRVLAASTARTMVREQGQAIRQAAQAEASALLRRDDMAALEPRLVPPTQPRRRAGWPTELSTAVDVALAAGDARPPVGVRYADWDRVLTARRQEATLTLEELRRLGPEVKHNQVLLTMDEVLTRQAQPHQFWILRTARLTTARGTQHLSGRGNGVLRQVQALTRVCRGGGQPLLLIADDALDPHLLRGDTDRSTGSHHDPGLVASAQDVRGPEQHDPRGTPRQAFLPPPAGAPLVARRGGRRARPPAGLSPHGQEPGEARRADYLPR